METLFPPDYARQRTVESKIDNVNLKRDEFTVRGKGGKTRIVFLFDAARARLKAYLDKRTDPRRFYLPAMIAPKPAAKPVR